MEDSKVKQTFLFCFFFFLIINFSYWIIVDLQCCVSFCLYSKMSHLYFYPLPFRFYSHVVVQSLSYAQLSCPPPTSRTYSNSCPSHQWCHPTISSYVVPLSSCLQSFPASGSFPRSQFFTSGGQSIGVSASASVLPMNIQDWFPLGWNGWISLKSKRLSRAFANITVQKHQFFGTQLSLQSNSHIHTWLLEKP